MLREEGTSVEVNIQAGVYGPEARRELAAALAEHPLPLQRAMPFEDILTAGMMAGSGTPTSSQAKSDDSSGHELVPIVLGGPWGRDGKVWERWTEGIFHDWNRTAFRVRAGHIEGLAGSGNWMRLSRPNAGEKFHAPEGWTPTPTTIPMGCCIQTPEGCTRGCLTCANYHGPATHAGCVAPTLNGWCPKPETKPEESAGEVVVGRWCWSVGYSGNAQHHHVVRITQIRRGRGLFVDPTNGCENGLDVASLRPMKVGDKIRTVVAPKEGAPGNWSGTILRLEPNGDPGMEGPHAHVSGYAIRYEDIRLEE